MKRLIEVLKPEEPSSETEGHSKPCSDQKTSRDSIPAERDEKGSFNQKAGDEENEINHEIEGDMAAVESKFEYTKRKLQESYKNIENGICFLFFSFFFSKEKLEIYNLIMGPEISCRTAKKQRRIQVIDFQPQPMPKQIASHKLRHPRSKKCNSRLPTSKKYNSHLLIGQH